MSGRNGVVRGADQRGKSARAIVRGSLLAASVWVLFCCLFADPGLGASWPEAKIISRTADEMVVGVAIPGYSLDTLEVDGRAYRAIIGTGLVPFAEPGEPDIPIISTLIAIPPGADLSIASVERANESVATGVRILPVERVAGPADDAIDFADFIYSEKDSIYRSPSPFPGASAWLTDRGMLRHQEVVRLVVAPFIYEPAREQLRIARSITVTLRIEGVTGLRTGVRAPVQGPAPLEDAFEGVYKGSIVNYEEGKTWRRAGPAMMLRGAQSAQNPRFKITVAETGLHRVEFDTLRAAGFPEGIAVGEVFVYRDVFKQGEPDTLAVTESACNVIDRDGNGVLSGGDAIEFYALNFYDQFGRRGNEDAFFDKNIYWLSWATGDHRRIAARPGWRDAVAPEEPFHFPDFIHVEQDSYFVNYPPQEGMDIFVWTRQRRITPFDLPGIDTSFPTTLTARFVNYYNLAGYPSPSTVTLYMTGCEGVQVAVGTVTTPLPSVRVQDVALPAGLLCEAGDVFRFESSITNSAASPGNVLDWFEVAYERRYRAEDDFLIFTNGGVTGEVEYSVTGFSSTDIRLFDVSDSTGPVAIDLEAQRIMQDGDAYRFVFRDSVETVSRYLAFCAPREIEVAAGKIASVDPPQARGVQADYLIVSHPDFVSELARIVQRRSAEGRSVFLATTDGIYNDFGNGMKSDAAIKRFIKDCFYSGNAQFVLLVGDANTDHRGLLANPPSVPLGTQPPSDIDYLPTHDIRRREDETRTDMEIRPSDNWFVTLGGASDSYPDLYLGRIPVATAAETRTVVDKIVKFEDDNGSTPWKKRVLVVADDEYKWVGRQDSLCYYPSEAAFMWACDSAAAIAKDFCPTAIDTVRFFLKRCVKDDQAERRAHGECTAFKPSRDFTKANCTPALVSLMNEGALLVNYQGHANRDKFTHEELIQDGGNSTNPAAFTDIRDLRNTDRPFIFEGYGCNISEFARRAEITPGIQDAIGEKFLTAPLGGACASFASGCSESIGENRAFNPFAARAMFSELQGIDPQGNPVPARVVLGEVLMTALIRFSRPEFTKRYLLFGDPAMVVDMGPPAVEASVNGVPADEAYVFEGASFDTVRVVSELKDEEAIMTIGLDRVSGAEVSPVPQDSFSTEALLDQGFPRSRAYRITYDHVPVLGDYAIRITGTDYAGKQTSFDIRVNTGSATFLRDEAVLEEGGTVVFGQVLRARLARPFPFAETDITALLDGVPASDFAGYTVGQKDAEGRVWEVSFVPGVGSGTHVFEVGVSGFKARRTFNYSGVRVDLTVDGRSFFENDFVSGTSEVGIDVVSESPIGAGDISVEVDGEAEAVEFGPGSGENEWVGVLGLGGLGLGTGDHTLEVRVSGTGVVRAFRVSAELGLLDVSVFPNPFSGTTYFYYTLTESADRVRLLIYTVSGREIVDEEMSAHAGYNQEIWDGRDSSGDRIANGTYIYKIVVESGKGRREFVGRLVKLG